MINQEKEREKEKEREREREREKEREKERDRNRELQRPNVNRVKKDQGCQTIESSREDEINRGLMLKQMKKV